MLSDIENQTTEEESEDCEVVEAEPVIVIPARTPATGSEEDDSRAKKRTPPTAVFGRRRSQYTQRKGQTKRKVDLHVEREKRCNGKVLCFRIPNRDDPNKADVRGSVERVVKIQASTVPVAPIGAVMVDSRWTPNNVGRM